MGLNPGRSMALEETVSGFTRLFSFLFGSIRQDGLQDCIRPDRGFCRAFGVSGLMLRAVASVHFEIYENWLELKAKTPDPTCLVVPFLERSPWMQDLTRVCLGGAFKAFEKYY